MLTKVIRIGTINFADIFCKIKVIDGKLSITGVIGPQSDGNCLGSCGQIIIEFKEYDSRGRRTLDNIQLKPCWNKELLKSFFDIWDKWHNNDLRAGCEHQRKMGWDKKPIDLNKPLESYGKHFDGQKFDSWNMLVWVTPEEYKDGLLTKKCPECGYGYGTQWLKEELPEKVIDFLTNLPETNETPEWI